MRRCRLLFLSLVVLVSVQYVRCEDGAEDEGYGDGDDAVDDVDDAIDDDANNAADDYEYVEEEEEIEYGDDYIKYWTEYALSPKRCIVYNDVDVIMFSVFEHGYKQCSDQPMGTYLAPVATFVRAYLNQIEANEEDKGNDDYVTPDSSEYLDCQEKVVGDDVYYVQLGCSDSSSSSLSVNIYSDNTCETKSEVEGYDDSNIDVSEIQVPFKSCQACVVWVDKNDDAIDDQFYENRKVNAPLCSTVWQYKSECNKSCQKMGVEKTRGAWNTSDRVLLAVLNVFGCSMLIAILQKRQLMSNKDTLLEQAAMTAAGLQQTHVVGIFILVLVVIVIFATLGMKNITWAMLLIMNTILFAYLMKLTVDGSVAQTVVGPDGKIIRIDSDDTSIASSNQLEPPTIPAMPLSTDQPHSGTQIT